MAPDKSLDELNLITALLNDAQLLHGSVFNTRALRLTKKFVARRVRSEGLGFLTKSLPKLGKSFDKALAEECCLNAATHRFKPMRGSQLPRFLGELFSQVLQPDGSVLPNPNVECVRLIRDILFCFYKYETPFNDEQVRQVLLKFERTERELTDNVQSLAETQAFLECAIQRNPSGRRTSAPKGSVEIVRDARRILSDLFSHFDPFDIIPSHGPGAVATKQRLWEKYDWTNISDQITSVFPLDAYFFASNGHVCDSYTSTGLNNPRHSLDGKSLPAKVILVPKDSRGPRLISCEPIDFQWIQQGLHRAIVRHVESNPLTKWNVFFTDQGPNRRGAQLGSMDGRYSTLDLNEASDRVNLELVRLLFPPHITVCLEACRTSSTVLPCGKELKLQKFAPMGSALCFPILALTIWSLLAAGSPDEDTLSRILVYGDDVIVPTAYAESAMSILESFGLKINRDKSCTKGFFRESCGMDAFKGSDVTPVKIKTVWKSKPSPDVYVSYLAYANEYYRRHYYSAYETIVREMQAIYGYIPTTDLQLEVPSVPYVPVEQCKPKRRWNKNLQKFEYRVPVVRTRNVTKVIPGWSMLLRYFTEAQRPPEKPSLYAVREPFYWVNEPFTVSKYTKRRSSLLEWCWR